MGLAEERARGGRGRKSWQNCQLHLFVEPQGSSSAPSAALSTLLTQCRQRVHAPSPGCGTVTPRGQAIGRPPAQISPRIAAAAPTSGRDTHRDSYGLHRYSAKGETRIRCRYASYKAELTSATAAPFLVSRLASAPLSDICCPAVYVTRSLASRRLLPASTGQSMKWHTL